LLFNIWIDKDCVILICYYTVSKSITLISMCIYYIGATGKWIVINWYISCSLIMKKVREVVHWV